MKETKELIAKLTKSQDNTNCELLDVSNREQVRKVCYNAKRAFGDVDILINNAAIVGGKGIMELNEHFIRKAITVNVESHFWLISEFLPDMIRKNDGHIVSIASIAGMVGNAGMTEYCACKHANVGMMEALKLEMMRDGHNVRTTTICPIFFNSGMFEGAKGSFLNPILSIEYL